MALVYFGADVVTVPDDSYQLKDILDAFHQSRGFIRRRGGDGQVVATLPFESLPSYEPQQDVYELVVPSAVDDESERGVAAALLASATTVIELLRSGHGAGGDAGHAEDDIGEADKRDYTPHLLRDASSIVYPPSVYSPYAAVGGSNNCASRWHSSPSYFAACAPYSVRPIGCLDRDGTGLSALLEKHTGIA